LVDVDDRERRFELLKLDERSDGPEREFDGRKFEVEIDRPVMGPDNDAGFDEREMVLIRLELEDKLELDIEEPELEVVLAANEADSTGYE
jgi:hypothetical protein